MAARFTEQTEAEIVALLEKATPENTKKQLHMALKVLMVLKLWKMYMKKYFKYGR